jgi:hypothetical protein
MNEVSIIINGVRYDAVEEGGNNCRETCDLWEICCEYLDESSEMCYDILGFQKVFKESDKKFEA